mgnify:FL=1
MHASAGFTEIRASLDALLKNLGLEGGVEPQTHPGFLDGRCGAVVVNDRHIGIVGELSPQVILAWGLGLPVAAFELDMAGLKT